MARGSKARGNLTKLVVKVNSLTSRVTFTMVFGTSTNRASSASTKTPKAADMKAHGKTINSMVKAMKPGLMDQATRASTKEVKSKEMESTHGQTDQCMKASGVIIGLTALECISGLMGISITVSGLMTKCTVTVFTIIMMAPDLKVNSRTIRKTDTGFTSKGMDVNLRGGGAKAKSMVWAST